MARPVRSLPDLRHLLLPLLLLLLLSAVGPPAVQSASASADSCSHFVNNVGQGRPKRTVRCNHGNLTRVPQRPPNLHQVTELLLDDNKLARLDELSFFSWQKLLHLSLRNNRITKVAVRTFLPLRDLRRLSLSGNRLHLPAGLPPTALAHVTELRELDLSFNPLRRVPPYHFQVLGNLQILGLRGARPALRLDSGSFAGLQRLHTIDLTSNYLSSLPEAAFRGTRLTTLLLGGSNPWVCDCRVRWLKLWQQRRLPLRSRHYLDSSDRELASALRPVCLRPEKLKGRDMFDLDLRPADFQCAPAIRQAAGGATGPGGAADTAIAQGAGPDGTVVGSLVRAHAGDNVSFTCDVFADPLSGLEWFKEGARVSTAHPKRPFMKTRSTGPVVRAQLRLPRVGPRDSGRWSCMAWNEAGQALRSFDLRVVRTCPASSMTAGILGVTALIAWALFLLAAGLFCFYSLHRRHRRRLSVRRAKKASDTACNLYQEEKL